MDRWQCAYKLFNVVLSNDSYFEFLQSQQSLINDQDVTQQLYGHPIMLLLVPT